MNRETLTQKLHEVFIQILKGTITQSMVAEEFAKLNAEGYNYAIIKRVLFDAGDEARDLPKDFYTREDLMKTFHWKEKALKINLAKWGFNPSSKIQSYPKEKIHEAAKAAGWNYNSVINEWLRPVTVRSSKGK